MALSNAEKQARFRQRKAADAQKVLDLAVQLHEIATTRKDFELLEIAIGLTQALNIDLGSLEVSKAAREH